MKHIPRYLSEAEVRILLAKPDVTRRGKRDRLFFELLLGTGLRRAEALALRPCDLSLRDGVLTVISGKGDKDRVVPISSRLCADLLDYAEYEHVGLEERIWPYSLTWGSNLVSRYAMRAGLEGVHCHSLRHTYAIMSIRAGRDLATIQQDMGHSDPKTTFQYLKISPEDRKRVHAAHPLPWEMEE